MAVRIRKGEALGALNITPLIDVVFQLLIFFLVATRFAQEDRELDLPLPSASEARPVTSTPDTFVINVDDRGQYFVDGRFLSIGDLERVLRQAKSDNPAGQPVQIRGDKRVPLEHVVGAMNACNKAGLYDCTITTAGEQGAIAP